jgi:hypothetical protein
LDVSKNKTLFWEKNKTKPPDMLHRLLRIRPLGLFRFQNLFSETYESIGQMVGLLGRVIGSTQGPYLHRTTQHRKTRTHIHVSSGIRTHDPSVRAAEDSTCLRPLGHWNRPVNF